MVTSLNTTIEPCKNGGCTTQANLDTEYDRGMLSTILISIFSTVFVCFIVFTVAIFLYRWLHKTEYMVSRRNKEEENVGENPPTNMTKTEDFPTGRRVEPSRQQSTRISIKPTFFRSSAFKNITRNSEGSSKASKDFTGETCDNSAPINEMEGKIYEASTVFGDIAIKTQDGPGASRNITRKVNDDSTAFRDMNKTTHNSSTSFRRIKKKARQSVAAFGDIKRRGNGSSAAFGNITRRTRDSLAAFGDIRKKTRHSLAAFGDIKSMDKKVRDRLSAPETTRTKKASGSVAPNRDNTINDLDGLETEDYYYDANYVDTSITSAIQNAKEDTTADNKTNPNEVDHDYIYPIEKPTQFQRRFMASRITKDGYLVPELPLPELPSTTTDKYHSARFSRQPGCLKEDENIYYEVD
ncbi:uncharacterized protein LOC135153284 [Lytechinus pictus]|uniref:uncharacterized protein LOC135153284 n=1 Tax=Lytechinus pictus TaxID=7653 RepID=UPI0030B9DB2F